MKMNVKETSKMNDPEVFELSGHTYQIKKLSVFEQLNLISRLSIVIATVGEQPDKNLIAENFSKIFCSFAATMTPDDQKEIFRLALSIVYRKTKTVWQPVLKNGNLQFQDIDLRTTLNLLWRVITAHSLSDFFSTSPTEANESSSEAN